MSDFTFNFTQQQLGQCIGNNPYIDHWYHALSLALPDYDINTTPRVAAFLAQCGHESGDFVFLQENLNYKAESLMRVWPKYFPNMDVANQYAHKPEKIANRAYANRMGNGPEESGDGWAHCGRGLIQLTGKSNYQAFADSIETPIQDIPHYLATFEGAVQSACWFWESHNLNALADAGDMVKMTKIINGGTLGMEDRVARFNKVSTMLRA
jgi:putative chitinase